MAQNYYTISTRKLSGVIKYLYNRLICLFSNFNLPKTHKLIAILTEITRSQVRGNKIDITTLGMCPFKMCVRNGLNMGAC